MLGTLKRTLLAGLGLVAFSHEKLKSVIDELVSRGEITRDQGVKLFDTLVKRGEEESEEISDRLVSETRNLRDLFPATRSEFQRLVERVEALELRLRRDGGSGDSGSADPVAPEPDPAATAAAATAVDEESEGGSGL